MASQEVPSTSQWRLELKDLPIVRRLGRGFSGYLYETIWDGKKHARKDFPLGSEERNRLFEAEVKPLFNLDHPSITKCFGYTAGTSSCSLLQEYVHDNLQNTMQGRKEIRRKKANYPTSTSRPTVLDVDEIRRLLSARAKRKGISAGIRSPIFEVPEAAHIISQIATAMKYLHDSEVVHGDLKPRNVLVDLTGAIKAKVADFGLTETKKRIELVSERSRQFEILQWKAPERFAELLGPDSDDPFTEITGSDPDDEMECCDDFLKSTLALADVYSFGLTCSYILGGKVMFPHLSLTQLRKQRMRGFKPELPSACPEYLRLLIYSCLESEPSSRPSFSGICARIIGERLHLQMQLMKEMTVAQYVEHLGSRVASNSGPETFTIAQYVEHLGSRVASNSGPETSSDISVVHGPIIQAVARRSSFMEVKNYVDYELPPSSDESDEGLTNLTREQRRPRGFGNETQAGVQTPAPSVDLRTQGPFKSWQHTRILVPHVLQTNDRTNQELLRRGIDIMRQIPNLQQAGVTNQNEAAFVQAVGSQGSRVAYRCSSEMNQPEDAHVSYFDQAGPPRVQRGPRGGSRIASMGPVHTGNDDAGRNQMMAERRRRVKQKENFTTLRSLVPITSRADKASILGDAIVYLKDLQEQVMELEASRNEVQSRFESLQVSYKELEESRNETQRRFESLQVSYKDLEQQKNEVEARAYSVGLIN